MTMGVPGAPLARMLQGPAYLPGRSARSSPGLIRPIATHTSASGPISRLAAQEGTAPTTVRTKAAATTQARTILIVACGRDSANFKGVLNGVKDLQNSHCSCGDKW